MKTVSACLGILVISVLLSWPAYAKKGKGEAYQIQPTITAEQAKAAVTAVLPQLGLGKPFTKQGKKGNIKLEVPMMLEGKVVGKVRLNPLTGVVLVKGQKLEAQRLSVSPEQAVAAVQKILPNLQVGSAWLGKQGLWKVPLLYQGAVINEMSVHGQNGSGLPDWKAAKDVSLFGR
jgi:hypothetical protein